jgi:hypothetical protein
MKFNVSAVAATSALIWSGAVLTVGIANAIEPRYGRDFLRLVSSIYPGYKAEPTPEQIAVGTAYAAVDGAVGGAIFAALYNCFVSGCGRREASDDESDLMAA